MTLSQQLTMIVGNRMFENEPMFKHTNFRIGGPAKWFVEIKSLDELQGVLEVIKENQLSFFVLGGGSNILVSDQGFDGVVVKMAMRTYEIQGKRIKSDAGVLASALARATATHGLKGLTWAISLPGTVGGGVRGNAGCFGGEMKDYFISAFVLRDGELIELKKEDLAFGYRESVIKHNNDIIVSATFELQEGDPTELKIELDDKLMRRKKSQPLDAGSAGCLFKNYEIKNDEDVQRLASYADIPPEMWSARRISAGWLIDNLGLKGTHIGGAKISEQHGNFVVNTGSATADDVVQLVALIKTRARNEYGIVLQEEVQYVGF
ncbi:MAG: UDP-N-acetylenolpyruvoylglucosamine reductase [Candidatus Uhrbacteria bacterium GW2011_GWF2_39_13]|uniref:UDP-N-acetylenolpyruvoylglucosamine reductase n=1 Tax=Candidatus Uhrbacteria bacterium GW2011_GWF2_39_13 TaxID=1618995 RepID=A0A0G0MKA3_9BACT|nr:MAG: UDP-N-acetylenolpyruvoylglucosamine reductase [Candidatus Uhrbacteria bacterium GW2011_GWF2_39_13]HAU65749.1 UDP-N-acetylenolpyruvoylglucosamine reductase [Candidatus Uhrbacteria bacterium]